LQNGILMHHAAKTKKSAEAEQMVLPIALRNKSLFTAHDIPAAGHLGYAKTKARLWPHVYWPRMQKDVLSYCRSCDQCQRVGKGKHPAPAPLIPLPIIGEPFKRIAIDVVGPLPICSKSKNRFILSIIDMATHYPEAVALTNHTAEQVAQTLASHFSKFGFPEEILSDQGPEFVSALLQIFCNDFHITQIRASAYHPQTNGSCERFHRTLKSMLRTLADEFKDAWDECLPWILFAYREIPVEPLGFSPFELLYGRAVRGPLSLLKSQWQTTALEKAKPNVLNFF
jgi:transposase InsO family protein